jgi:tetratricopeptide (TPR) repeat protein
MTAFAHCPEDRVYRQRAIDIRLEARSSLVALGELAPILEHLRHAERLAETLGDNRQRSLVAFALAHLFWATGHHGRAIESGRRALDLASSLDDLSPRILVGIVLGEAHYSLGKYEEAIARLRKNLELLRGDLRDHYFPPAYSAVITRRWLVLSLAELGSFGEAVALSNEGMEIARALDHPVQPCQYPFGSRNPLRPPG